MRVRRITVPERVPPGLAPFLVAATAEPRFTG
jgi:hypothetical protein